MTNYALRLATHEDISFIYATWLKSYKSDSSIGNSLRTSVFMKDYVKVIDSILQDKSTVVTICCDNEDAFVIYAYMVSAENLIHYIFVKDAFRRFGLAKALIESKGFFEPICTHKTRLISNSLENFNINYNPLLLYKGV